MATGKVKFYSKEKGFGFIMTSNNEDYFFHATDIKDYDNIFFNAGDEVSFEPSFNNKGLKAINIKLVKRCESQENSKTITVIHKSGKKWIPNPYAGERKDGYPTVRSYSSGHWGYEK